MLQGVGQGRILSTHNYKTYINGLLDELTNTNVGTSIGPIYTGAPTCADDVILMANSSLELQTQADVVTGYAHREIYQIHPAKSRCVTFNVKFPAVINIDGQDVTSSEPAVHLGITRHSNTLSSDEVIQDRIALGRRTACSLMGAGFHGVNGISPKVSLHLYDTYVLPRVLYGLEGTILKQKHLNDLERFHKGMIRDLQSLPTRTSTSAVYLLSGQLPLEALMDIRLGTLLAMTGKDCDSILAQVGLHQLGSKNAKSHSWFVYCARRLAVYGLDPLEILMQTSSKQSIKRAIAAHWRDQLVNDARGKTTLIYVQLDGQKFDKPHPIWSCIDFIPAETRKAAVKARLLTGTYILQSTRASFNQYEVNDTCPICESEREDRPHLLLRCSAYAKIRDKYMDRIACWVPNYASLDETSRCQLILDSNFFTSRQCNRESLEAATRQYVFSVTCKRQQILNQAE